MPTPGTTQDPNQITDPTGGAPNFNILDVFKEFGYQPTQAEISALAPSFEGKYGGGQIGTNAVAQYVNYRKTIDEFNANDPLTGLQKQMDELITQNQSSVQNLHQQLQDTLSSAPQLFGSLTPDQIQTYLAPLKTSFDKQIESVQGILASRGLGASSTEANALAQTNQQFQEGVLQAGLNIGLTSQKNKADALQAQINNLFGQTGQAISAKSGAAGQQSQQKLGESQLIGSLPSFLNAQSAQEEAINTTNANQGGFWDTFNKVTSGINQGVRTFQTIAQIPAQFQSNPGTPQQGGGNPATLGTPPPSGSGGAPFQTSFGSPVDPSTALPAFA